MNEPQGPQYSASIWLADEAATLRAGAALADALVASRQAGSCNWPSSGLHVHLIGNLGAGKTTLVRGLLRALGVSGAVKSPTYTIVEPYSLPEAGAWTDAYHFDLYRVNDPEELDLLGVRDYFRERAICLFEWPERGNGALPPASLTLRLTPGRREQVDGRELSIDAVDGVGEALKGAFRSALLS